MTGISSLISRINIVRQIPIFSKLNWLDLQKIARKARLEEYQKGAIIRSQGDPADFFYCLVSGRVQAYTVDPKQKKDYVEFIHRGMHFGIISLLTGENHSLNFEAINDSVVLKIEKDDFHKILQQIPSLGLEFSQSLSRRVRGHVTGKKLIFESTIVSIYSPVKGSGSSTYALQLALGLARETQKKIILVNIHVASSNGNSVEDSGGAVAPRWEHAVDMKDIVGDHDKIFHSIRKGSLEVDRLNVVFDGGDLSLKKMISPLVSTLVGAYHYVVVDLPNDMDDFVVETLAQSDDVHLLCMDRRKDLDLIKNVLHRLELAFKENYKSDRIKVVVRGVRDQVYLSYEEINTYIDFDVYTMLPHIKPEEILKEEHAEGIHLQRFSDDCAYAKTITRIARQMGGVMIGLALGGGAALGVAHIGVIRVLERENIPIDVVVGSSMGALIGSFWAVGLPSEELEKAAREFEKKAALLKLFDPFIVPIAGLIGDRAIKRWLRKRLGNKTFYSTQIPFKVVTYDLVRREEIIINSGSLLEAVRKSIAIPGVLEPVLENEKMLIDGGVLNPLPTNVLSSLGIKKIIAVNVLQSPEHVSHGQDMIDHEIQQTKAVPFFKNPFKYVGFRVGRFFGGLFSPNIADIIVRTLQASEYVIAEQSAQQSDVVIHPDLSGINWYELHRVDDLIKAGEEATLAVLPKIKKLIEVERESVT